MPSWSQVRACSLKESGPESPVSGPEEVAGRARRHADFENLFKGRRFVFVGWLFGKARFFKFQPGA
jgi:hypothetical protein